MITVGPSPLNSPTAPSCLAMLAIMLTMPCIYREVVLHMSFDLDLKIKVVCQVNGTRAEIPLRRVHRHCIDNSQGITGCVLLPDQNLCSFADNREQVPWLICVACLKRQA